MKNKQSTHVTHGNFWTGFSLGSILALITLYTLGTKKGRNYLQKVIGMAENWEDRLETLAKEVRVIVKNQKQENNKDSTNFIGQLLEKIKFKSI